jgi:hypothetical protein
MQLPSGQGVVPFSGMGFKTLVFFEFLLVKNIEPKILF